MTREITDTPGVSRRDFETMKGTRALFADYSPQNRNVVAVLENTTLSPLSTDRNGYTVLLGSFTFMNSLLPISPPKSGPRETKRESSIKRSGSRP